MRMWHKDLIEVLPRKQLLGQIREITLILKDIYEKGKTNHMLINKVMNYPLCHLYTYCNLLKNEMKKRRYNLTQITLNKWNLVFKETDKKLVDLNVLFNSWHNEDYLKICYFNLYEKFLCDGISNEEFKKIRLKFNF